MKNKIILITGATGGIGKAAAIALAKQNFTVVIHGRDEQKTLAVCNEIRQLSGNENIDMLVADLFLMKDVEKLAAEFKQRYDHLDVLINNAGGIMSKEIVFTEEHVEKTFAVNVLAPFILSDLLLSLLKKSKHGRIINVSSNSHKLNANPDFSDIQLKKNYNPLRTYGNAKLFLIWNTLHLSAELKKEGANHVTVNTLHPGAVKTNFAANSDFGVVINFISKLFRPFFKTAENGAATLIYLATSPAVAELSGKYFVDCKEATISTKYYSVERERKIWDYCKNIATKNRVDL